MQNTLGQERATDSGFTLVELLIVIVILGVLSTVTVFAVQGIADRGETAASDADEATLARAQEAHMATEGVYASESDLVAAGLLREESSNLDVTVADDFLSYDIVEAGSSATTAPPVTGPGAGLPHSISYAGFQAWASSTDTGLTTIVAVNDAANRWMIEAFLSDNPTLSPACRIVYVEDPALDTVNELVSVIDSAPHTYALSREALVTRPGGAQISHYDAYVDSDSGASAMFWSDPMSLQSLYNVSC